MPRTLLAAAVQLAAHSRASFHDAWPDVVTLVNAAAEAGANLIVLPEGTLPAYVLGYEPYEEAETAAALQECCALAKRHGVVLIAGAARREGNRVYNSAIAVDRDGSIAGRADKHFLWHFDRQWFAPGERIEPIRTSIGSIGALVCADGRIPTISRALVDAGADVLVMPTAWVTSGRDPRNFENAQADLLARVRARENGVPFIAANKCGVEMECVAYCGKSQIVSGQGQVLALASQDRAETITASITIGELQPQRSRSTTSAPHMDWNTQQRVAITHRSRRAGDDALLRILEADVLIDANYPGFEDDALLDPGTLAALRLSENLRLAVWRTSYEPAWQVTFARARALELRMYVIVIDAQHERAYAMDPDGAVLCGTFGDYEIASFAFDPARTTQTAVAPGTDVLEGLRRAQTHAR
ncbi:MAG TPA: carbon-nitrogen hydrolase family protein [Candidatus Baltobacteraceae bacterium]|nr:carbon-nitrogen hydrolase family protein [Candidatus Baltobacteraceae bacterium]